MIFNKICQNDITRYCHNGIINLLFSKFKKLKLGGDQDTQATLVRVGVKIPQEILTPRGKAARGYLDPPGASCPGVKINRYTGTNFFEKMTMTNFQLLMLKHAIECKCFLFALASFIP